MVFAIMMEVPIDIAPGFLTEIRWSRPEETRLSDGRTGLADRHRRSIGLSVTVAQSGSRRGGAHRLGRVGAVSRLPGAAGQSNGRE